MRASLPYHYLVLAEGFRVRVNHAVAIRSAGRHEDVPKYLNPPHASVRSDHNGRIPSVSNQM
jgi:hypothetical protein